MAFLYNLIIWGSLFSVHKRVLNLDKYNSTKLAQCKMVNLNVLNNLSFC